MALNTNNPHGTIRGSIGGNTFTANKVGQIIRAKIKPVQSFSPAVLATKRIFASGAKTWRSRSLTFKNYFNVFAPSDFVPLKKINVGQYSGYQAYLSCRNMINAGLNRIVPSKLKIPQSEPAWRVPAQTPIIDDVAAAIVSVTPTMKNTMPSPTMLNLSSGGVYSDNTIEFSFNYYTGQPGPYIFEFCTSWESAPYQFFAYLSKRNKSGNLPKSELFYYCLGSTGFIDGSQLDINTDLNGETSFSFHMDYSSKVQNYKSFPGLGDGIIMTIVIVDFHGTACVLGSLTTEVISR